MRMIRRAAGGVPPARPALPDGLRVYAVGDIHGCFDLLQILYAEIRNDAERQPPARSIEIFLGDYIDRGARSCDVVEWLVSSAPACDERICLMGNHEDMLLNVLSDPGWMDTWLYNGGLQTMISYGVAAPRTLHQQALLDARSAFMAALPSSHLRFLKSLSRLIAYGDYLFVHAGIHPERSLEDQDPDDLVWIREPFLFSSDDFGKIVVHGHTPAEEPDIRSNRINVDTGAVFTGRLTCLVLEGTTRRFLQASASNHPSLSAG